MRPYVWLSGIGRGAILALVILTRLQAGPLDSWHPRNPQSPEGSVLNGVAFGAGLFVAAGKNGAVKKSSDGITWLDRAAGITNDFSAVGYGNGLFVGLAGSKILTSTNGDAWAEDDLGTTISLNGIAFGNGVFVIVGGDLVSLTGTGQQHGVVLTSGNGSDWTLRDAGITNSLSGVAFGDGLFVAVGERNSLITSTDGITWTPRDTGTSTFSFSSLPDFYDVTYGNSRFVVVGHGAYRVAGAVLLSLTSSDGSNWTGHTVEHIGSIGNAVTGFFTSVSHGENVFVAFDKYPSLGWVSTDGIVWRQSIGYVSSEINDLTFGKGMFVAVGGNLCAANCEPMTILTSDDDGINWVARVRNNTPAVSFVNLATVTYGNGLLIAAGGNPYMPGNFVPYLTSVDGYQWTSRDSTTSERFTRLIHDNDLFLALAGTAILTSTDGTNWIPHDGITSSALRGVTSGSGGFVVVGSGGAVLTSTNGTSWKTRTSGTIRDLNGVAYGNNIFVAAGASGAVVTSPDAIDWNYMSLAVNQSFNDVGFANGLFVAVGGSGLIMSSVNGVDWTNRVSETSSNLLGVYLNHDWFIALGEAGTILTSADAVNWTSRNSGTSNNLRGAVSMNDTFIVVGDGGTILQSDPLTNTAPHIIEQPRSQTVLAGATLGFEVSASGTSPFSYQWLKGDTPVPGATNRILALFNVQSSDIGTYTVAVTNLVGPSLSEGAALAVDERPRVKAGFREIAQVRIYGIEGRNYRIDYANDLEMTPGWQTLMNISLTNTPFAFSDSQSTNYAKRFYRAVLLP